MTLEDFNEITDELDSSVAVFHFQCGSVTGSWTWLNDNNRVLCIQGTGTEFFAPLDTLLAIEIPR